MFPKRLVNSLSLAWLVIAAICLLLAVREAQAADLRLFVSCVETNADGYLRVHISYEVSETIEGTSYVSTENAVAPSDVPNILQAGRHDRLFAVDLVHPPFVWQFVSEDGTFEELTVTGRGGAPSCAAGTGEPDGGFDTVTKDVAPGCYEWSIQDDYGHWSVVATTCSQVEGDRVFTRLVLGKDNLVTDPARYRVWRVE